MTRDSDRLDNLEKVKKMLVEAHKILSEEEDALKSVGASNAAGEAASLAERAAGHVTFAINSITDDLPPSTDYAEHNTNHRASRGC